ARALENAVIQAACASARVQVVFQKASQTSSRTPSYIVEGQAGRYGRQRHPHRGGRAAPGPRRGPAPNRWRYTRGGETLSIPAPRLPRVQNPGRLSTTRVRP